MHIHPYLDFNGRCEEAVEFYKQVLGAELEGLMRFKENPDPHPITPGTENKVLHCSLKIGDSLLMASDGRCTEGGPKFAGIILTLMPDSEDEAQRHFQALAAGGQIHVPLAKTFFSPSFGMLADKFGVNWMILVKRI